jgi:hypothetical protein
MTNHRDFRDLKDLPRGFKPEAHSHKYSAELRNIKPTDLHEGVNLLDEQGKQYIMADVPPGGATIRCWNCILRPDGTYDCFRINCPWDPPAPNPLP